MHDKGAESNRVQQAQCDLFVTVLHDLLKAVDSLSLFGIGSMPGGLIWADVVLAGGCTPTGRGAVSIAD
jgi:hypothetical protein